MFTQNRLQCLYDRIGIKKLINLRLKFSPLNEHGCWQHYDCFSPCCLCGGEHNEAYLLLWPRTHGSVQLAEDPDSYITDMEYKVGMIYLNMETLLILMNRVIIEATISKLQYQLLLPLSMAKR